MVLTKDCIAEAAVRQIQKKGPDKITVKDIVEACSMTRQTFYYYFDDIPDLLLYLVQCRTDGLMRQAHRGGDLNEMLEGFVRLIDENDDFIRKLLNSRYHDIVDQMLFQFLHDFLFELMENELDMFLPKKDREFFICYHCFAIKDILIYWRKNNHISTEEAIAMVRTVAAEKAAGR